MLLRHPNFLLVFFLLLSEPTTRQSVVQAARTCQSDTECQERYNSSKIFCNSSSRTCSNPYSQGGCLYSRSAVPASPLQIRLCNSDDPKKDSTTSDLCQPSLFQEWHQELRIHQGNWTTALFMAWIHQVLLMEVVGVPATVGRTSNETPTASFYATTHTDFVFSTQALPYAALHVANQNYECHDVEEGPCVHVLPEVWPGQETEYTPFIDNKTIETDAGNGNLARLGLYLPLYTLQQYPSLAIWYGLATNDNRELLANIFHRPITWMTYCEQVSLTNCSIPDTTATRYPETTSEQDAYFVQGQYKGYFLATTENNCTATPNCTGHVVAPPCTWSARLDAQLYWNDIVGLASNGPLLPSNGYPDEAMAQIWRAANATQSHVLMQWYQPDTLPVEFLGTPYQFQSLILPPPTQECLDHRVDENEKCSTDFTVRVGDPRGSCGDDVQSLRRLLATTIRDQIDDDDEAQQSPAYDFLSRLKISTLDMRSVLQRWQYYAGEEEPDGLDARVAVCDWLVDNLDRMLDFVPPGYPRTMVQRGDYETWYLMLARVLGLVAATVALVASFLCYKYRKTKTMVFAQPLFLQLILFGFAMICVGAILYSLEPKQPTCTGAAWMLVLGYTVEMVPVVVKTMAINRLIRSSKKANKRVNISRRVMLLKVAAVTIMISFFLTAWTVVDPPRARVSYRMDPEDNSIVQFEAKCASDNDLWNILAFAWQLLLLIMAAILAFQSRDVFKQMNESKSLAMMVYSHFLFVILRLVFSIFYITDALPPSVTAALISCNHTFDALFAMGIYVLPKIVKAMLHSEDYRTYLFSTRKLSEKATSGVASDASTRTDHGDNSLELQVLVCTANIGNAEPTLESMKAWIPTEGFSSLVTPLEDIKSMPASRFDVISIGFQEATWKEKIKKEDSKARILSEEDVINAMEEKNTAQLREMIQEILGAEYSQLVDEQRGQMRLHIWASGRVVDNILDIEVSGANTGIGNVMANKGGIVTTFSYLDTRVTFLSAHLAAHEGDSYYKARCDNIRAILKEGKTFGLSKKLDVANSSHHMFVMGDLNFRTKFGNESNAHEANVKSALELIQAQDFAALYSFDELQEGLSKGDLLVGFKTLPISFPPTFKVLREPGFVYKEQRTPSYTDRILFKSAPTLENNLKALAYEPCTDFTTSDHKPIRGAFSISPNRFMDEVKVEGEYHLDFEQMKCFNLPAGDADGFSDPYLMFLWDSENLATEEFHFRDAIRTLWTGHSWPRTKYISKTLDPDWGDTSVLLKLRNCTVAAGEMLFIAVLDYDAISRDDCLGVLAVNLKDLISMEAGQAEKVVEIDRDLTKCGRNAGRIKLEVRIKREITRHSRGHRLSVRERRPQTRTSTAS